MKKFFKLFLFVSSFVFLIIDVSAAGLCDAHAIVTKKDLYDFDWAVPMDNICQLTKLSSNYNGTCGSKQDAIDHCKGTSIHPCTGEVSYNVNGCSEKSLCQCFYYPSAKCTYQLKDKWNSCCSTSKDPLTGIVECEGCYECGTIKSYTESFTTGAGADQCYSRSGNGYNEILAKQSACHALAGSGCDRSYDTGDSITQWKVQYPVYTCDASTGARGSIDSIYDFEHQTKGDFGDYISAYCVNPDEAVPKSTNVYQIDATKCKNSYSTVDCGFANIMIEGNYRSKIQGKSMYGDYAVILTALRLWAVHVGASGFDLVGFGQNDEDQTTVNNDDIWLNFVPNSDGSWDNYYELAYDNLLRETVYGDFRGNKLYNADTSISGFNSFRKIPIASASKGEFSDGVNQPANLGKYIYAFQLFLNTLQGNDKMQEHLLALNLNASGISKEDLEIKEDEMLDYNDPVYSYTDLVGEKTIRVTYRLRENVEIDCSTLPGEEANVAGCQMNQKITIYNSSGTIVETETAYDYCEKNVCFKEVTFDGYSGVISCDAIDKIEIEVDSYEECGARSVKKYLDCSNPRDSQMLVSFEADKNCDSKKPKKKKMTTFLQCDLCNDEPTFQDDSCVSKNGSILADNKNVIVSDDENHLGQKYVINYAKDPSLNCILNKRAFESDTINQQGRAYYDYSEMFGVNTNICKIYCSDSVDYYLPAREEVNSALQIKFDIHSRIFGDDAKNKTSKALTSVVVVERNCVSKSFYDQPFDYNVNWDIEYGLGNDQLLEHYQTFYRMSKSQAESALQSIKNKCGEVTDFKSMFCRLNELAKKENSRRELLNSLIYDLYNCNMFTEQQTINNTNGVIVKPKDADRNAILYAKELISNTDLYCNGDESRGIPAHDCVTGGIKYEGGSQYFRDEHDEEDYEYLNHDDSGFSYVGLNGNVPALSTDDNISNDLEIKYCSNTIKNGKKEGCFAGSSSDINGKKEFVDRMEYATVDSKWDTLSFLSSSVKVPSNDFTVFKFSVESQLYNSTKFYSEQFSGNVRNKTESNSSLYGSSDPTIPPKYLQLNDYVYPVLSEAKKVCQLNYHNIGISSSDMTSDCDINYDFTIPIINTYNVEKGQLGYKIAFDRKLYVDGLSKSIQEANDYTCVYTIGELEKGVGFAFKNIDLENPFPYFREKTNWSVGLNSDCYDSENNRIDCDYAYDKNGEWNPIPEKLYYKNYIGSVINEISNSADNNLYATDEYIEYSYRLDAETIEAIREYNNSSTDGYFEVPYGCTYTVFGEDSGKKVEYYSNCNSKFLDKLHSDENPFNVHIIKDDGISKYTIEKYGLQNGVIK